MFATVLAAWFLLMLLLGPEFVVALTKRPTDR